MTQTEIMNQLAESLKITQFGFNHRRCPSCAGWNMSEFGETDRVHRPDCPIKIALDNYEEFIK